MKKLFIFIFPLLVFSACSHSEKPEDTVKKYYEHLMQKEYVECFRMIDWGVELDDEEIDEKIFEMMGYSPEKNNITDYIITSQEKKYDSFGREYFLFQVKEFSEQNSDGNIEIIPIHKDANGIWKIYLQLIE